LGPPQGINRARVCGTVWIDLAKDKDKLFGSFEDGNRLSGSLKSRDFFCCERQHLEQR
jgi:hypothetical protein